MIKECQDILALNWRPVGSAPRDGTIIWLAGDLNLFLGFWMPGKRYECHGSVGGGWRMLTTDGSRESLPFAPTLWQPAPVPPAKTPERTIVQFIEGLLDRINDLEKTLQESGN